MTFFWISTRSSKWTFLLQLKKIIFSKIKKLDWGNVRSKSWEISLRSFPYLMLICITASPSCFSCRMPQVSINSLVFSFQFWLGVSHCQCYLHCWLCSPWHCSICSIYQVHEQSMWRRDSNPCLGHTKLTSSPIILPLEPFGALLLWAGGNIGQLLNPKLTFP